MWRRGSGHDLRGLGRSLLFFGCVLALQVGHLIEHIAKALRGEGLLGPSADSELSHFAFNGMIALLVVVLLRAHASNPWLYPLAALAVIHEVEHVVILKEYAMTGAPDVAGLLAKGGVLGIIPAPRQELHNLYNGLEVILLTLGFNYEVDSAPELHK